MGLNLWLVPIEKDREPLSALINEIAAQHEGPLFTPHITLLSIPIPPPGINEGVKSTLASALTTACASLSIAPFHLEWNSIDVGATFYQSVLASLQRSELLIKLYEESKKAFAIPADASEPPHFPHLSLFYGLRSTDAKEAIVRGLFEGMYTSKAVSREPSLSSGEGGVTGLVVAGLNRVTIGEVWLVKTDGLPDTWEVLAIKTLS